MLVPYLRNGRRLVFVDRRKELAFLNSILERERPSPAQFVLLYGRRRVGKTVLLRHWAEVTGLSHTYWAADKEPSALQRRKLFACVMGVEPAHAPTFDTWADCWQAIASLFGDRRHILILDEFTYPLQYGWLDAGEVVGWLRENRPPAMHLIITGRQAPDELIEYADLVTEMREVKHYYQQGVVARTGIEK